MRYEFIRAEKVCYPVSLLCRSLRVARSGFYAWLSRGESQREQRDRKLLPLIREAFDASRQTYGSPRVYEELRARGVPCSRRTIERLMREAGIRPPRRRKFRKTTDSDHPYVTATNLLDRDFSSSEPNRRWSTDITYIWTTEGWLYLAVVMDLFSRRIVGWSMRKRLARELVLSALRMALYGRDPGAGLVHHSDRGSQYASDDYQKELDRRGIVCSMSRKGDCWDNAVVESFFATLKRELVYRHRFSTRAQAIQAIFEYIEVFYNRQRRHSHLGYLSPEQFERFAEAAA
jgi:transposase InsO family protein